MRSTSAVVAACYTVWLAVAACGEPVPPLTRTGLVGGRVLVAPGAGLAGAHVQVDQVNLYDGKAEIRKHVGAATTDADGYFTPLPTGTINGLILIETSGGTFADPLSGAHIQLDASTHLRAVHWLGLFEDRSKDMYVTPVHTLIEARFREKMGILGNTTKAVNDAYLEVNAFLGALDWERVVPADLGMPATSPTDDVRAAFVLGGLAVLADDIRTHSNASPQAVNLMTFLAAAARDLGDLYLDGNDHNDPSPDSGLQVGHCPAVAVCVVPSGGCQLGACRADCDLYANTYRTHLADAISKFIGPKTSPSLWNHTTLGSDDARVLIDGIANDPDPGLFGDSCLEAPHRDPPTIFWEISPPDGALQGGMITLRVHAIDSDSNKLPTVRFQGKYHDTDGDPNNEFATITVDTRLTTMGIDGPLPITAVATNLAGSMSTSTRTFLIDNTAPMVTLDSTGLYVDSANVWWTATPGPTLHGTVSDTHGVMQVVVMIGGSVVATATVDGTQWTAQLPPDALSAGDVVSIVATDPAGNVATKVQTLRLDMTPPSVTVDPSPVSDEINSSFRFMDGPTGSFAEHDPNSNVLPVDLSTTGTCPTVHKYAHLMFAPQPDGVTHSVLGSSGALNPLQLNVVVSDDGVGIQPGSSQYRVLYNSGATLDEILPWTAMPAPTGSQRRIPFYRDAIPQLGTTNGEYHIQLRSTDQFGRTTTQERCWTHYILAPPLNPTSGSGELASGFQRALFSTELNPGPNETGDFAEKFLNANPAGAAIWRTRFKNYLGLPVYVTVQIPNDVTADVSREFRIMKSLTNREGPLQPIRCGNRHCISNPPPSSVAEYVSAFTPPIRTQLAFRARVFEMAGNETGPEAGPCMGAATPCLISADDVAQTYVFLIPARTAPQGSALPEYGFLTYLRSEFPAGNGTNVTMAPSDASYPDNDPAPYTEFMFEGATLTGKLMGTLFDFDQICVDEDVDSGGFFCTLVASHQRYRALSRISYQPSDDIVTTYLFSALLTLPPGVPLRGRLKMVDSLWSTNEITLP